MLDSSEHWGLHGIGWDGARSEVPPGAPPRFLLAPVLLHEIGHALGLTHCQPTEEVMAPHYSPERIALTPRDKERARLAYGVPPPVENSTAEGGTAEGGAGTTVAPSTKAAEPAECAAKDDEIARLTRDVAEKEKQVVTLTEQVAMKRSWI